MTRARSVAISSGMVASLSLFIGACTETLDAGRNASKDPCATSDAGLRGCTPTGLLDNLVGHWRLDDEIGSTVAFDSSGRGNLGALHGVSPSTAWVEGRSQGALRLAHAGWVQIAPSPSIDAIVEAVTISAWVNLEADISTADWATALSRQTGMSEDQHYHLSLNSDERPSLFLTTDSGFELIKGAASLPKNEWVHLAAVYDGAMARLYVNGSEVASHALAGRFAEDTTPIILGGNANNASGTPTELFPGGLDEVMLYARALSVSEIGQLTAGALFPGEPMDAGGL